MKKLITLICILFLSTATLANEVEDKSPLRDSVEGGLVVAGGTYAWVTAAMGGITSAAATTGVLIGASGVVGYGAGKIVRSIDNKTGKNLQNLIYVIGDKTKIFAGIRVIHVAT